MFQEEFTKTLQQLAHKGMSDIDSYRGLRYKKNGDRKIDTKTSKKNISETIPSIQLNLFEQ